MQQLCQHEAGQVCMPSVCESLIGLQEMYLLLRSTGVPSATPRVHLLPTIPRGYEPYPEFIGDALAQGPPRLQD
jgi:hypothetical protein